MNPAGSIHIDLYHCAGQANGVNIASSRPEAATQVLLGKTPEQLLDTVPLLFTLCGNAQSYAALLACRAAQGRASEPALDTARVMLVQLETLREHAWRILLDWPVFTGLAPDKKALAALFKFDAQFKRQLFQDGEAFKSDSRPDVDGVQLMRLIDELATLIDAAIFNGCMADFQTLSTEAQLRGWLQQSGSLPAGLLDYLYSRNWAAVGQNNVACLPELEKDALDRQMQQDGLAAFVRTPHWQGRCFETTLLNRQLAQPLIVELRGRYGHGLIVRIVARLLEVAGIPAQLKQLLAQIKDHKPTPAISTTSAGMALVQVQAARGLLIHRLVLRQGRVYDYRIVAPTEWNFHPDGVVVQSLRRLQAQSTDDLRRQAELLVNAIDPCVRYTLKLIDR
ncbi:MAG: nickel-dependent hydrogenase large subunit [Methylovulum sp.]|nr:nickel-dependent hydrogenase large subunit [Methylovulum sp.]